MRFKALYDKNNGTAPSLTNIRMAAVFCLTFLFCLFNVNIVSAGEPLWVAVGYGDTHSFASSNNGVDWTGRFGKDIFSVSGNDVAWSSEQNLWVAVGSGTNSIATSTDGINWQPVAGSTDIFSTGGHEVAWSSEQDLWVAVGSGTNSIATSTDGINWQPVAGSTGIFSNGNDVAWSSEQDLWVAVGSGTNSIATSTDGTNWMGRADSSLFSYSGNNVAWNGSKWIAVGSSSELPGNTIATSANGIEWDAGPQMFLQYGFGIACNDGGMCVAVGQGAGSIYYSISTYEGTSWTGRVHSSIWDIFGKDVAFGDNKWVAVGQGGIDFARSNDGIAWEANDQDIFDYGNGVAYGQTGLSTWIEPNIDEAPPYDGATTAPLNVSGVKQTKIGSLYVENTLDITGDGLTTAGPITVKGTLDIGSNQICLNTECRSDLNQDQPDYVHLRTANDYQTEAGYIRLGNGLDEGRMWVEASSQIGIFGEAGEPALVEGLLRPTYGLLGYAGTSLNLASTMSVGVYGEASLDDDNSIGVGGTQLGLGWNGAYGAYFKGNIKINGCLRFNSGACLDAWPNTAPSGQYVRLLEDDTTTQIGNVALDPDNSTSIFTNLTLGDEPSGLAIDVTCGDGFCNNGETRLTCEEDCFRIQQLAVGNITDGSAAVTWRTVIPASSVIHYGATADMVANQQGQSSTIDHSLVISSLNNNTTYYYQVTSVSESGRSRKSGIQTFRTVRDYTPPSTPTNLHTTTLSSTAIPLAWYHNMTDTPGGSGLANFIIYRDGQAIGSTTNSYYDDTTVAAGATYAYTVRAIDQENNLSPDSNVLVLIAPDSCNIDADCTDPDYPVCCVPNGCKASCGDGSSSPVVLKTTYEDYNPGGDYEPGGGW